ncbi:glycosyl hydrolase 108 family protein [Chelatococcus sp. SYSU_G07232]|uniref:Glycosyl hydrolase 108 family protein n=1 Tax=Chelatococcus albus TaxID=3047466 RepID=A0ABT7AI07_9HYPH|nr:glycosyl hydrolase 108 family protein [Chelatococcus sp. SYSU_G07232]MDJ1159017.1 glycosyl hydrolase 108 family protein [Chelatococcus sp. SYSU_G07232]
MAAASFERAMALVFALEGGFVNHPLDPGGTTNMGITRATLARARGRPVAVAEVMALTRAEAEAIYHRFYWRTIRADELPAGVDLALFDCAVHSGPKAAVRLLQRVLAVPADGLPGPVTLAAVARADPQGLVRALAAARLSFLARLSVFATFGRGWTRRVRRVEREALALATAVASSSSSSSSFSPSRQQRSSTMIETKSFLASRTVWANLFGLVAITLSFLGFDTSGLDSGALAEAALQVVAGASFILSTVFRLTATKRLAR